MVVESGIGYILRYAACAVLSARLASADPQAMISGLSFVGDGRTASAVIDQADHNRPLRFAEQSDINFCLLQKPIDADHETAV